MIKPYFIQISAVKMAAILLNKKLYDNYALHGALPQFASLNIGEIKDTEGIDDVPEKAESFVFGQLCGKVLADKLSGFSEEKTLYCEACIAREIFMKLDPETVSKYSEDEMKQSVQTIFKALVKRTQIRTHTAKPGGENINIWLASYNELQKDFDASVVMLVDAILKPEPVLDAKYTTNFFDRNDPLITLSLQNNSPEANVLITNLTANNKSVFADILSAIINQYL